jgi:hypothetical protein
MSASIVDPARIERNWQSITVELDVPAPSRLERLVRRLGVPARLTRVALATPGLRRAWFVAIAVVMFVALIAGDTATNADNMLGFLALAPLIPVLGVSFAYGVEADPSHEIGLATPMRGLTLVLTRAAVILIVSTLLLTLAALLNPAAGFWAVAWLLPSIALTFTTLAASTWLSPRKSAAVTTGGWLALLLVVGGAADDRLAAFTAPAQVLYLFIAAAAFVVVWQRRDRFDLLAVQL